ncbi:hypothetical protein C7974DRAFT_224681 [Boeremia exigua]|uniref:uncharacterized protein n=1 Tax=Boeremia exigua TaxID=749465 RepID=UPI001E8D5A0C|nr:uncharacterized protein C7974DRAFT_224681 [Boeremia exigua]KAH6620020.1 hypothetical protein C7974DRAFT_224681 [Boeremia exigua]
MRSSMLLELSVLVAALEVGSAFAAPAVEHHEQHLEDIRCRCLTFSANERPKPCNTLESRDLDWMSAQNLASQLEIPVRFASKTTISKVLAISIPLPTDILQTTGAGDAQSSSSEAEISQNKMVCGFGQEVRRMSSHSHDREPEDHFVAQVVAWFMLFIGLYLAGEYLWTRYSSSNRVIKLKGEEKPLKAKSPKTASSNLAASNFT